MSYAMGWIDFFNIKKNIYALLMFFLVEKKLNHVGIDKCDSISLSGLKAVRMIEKNII